MVVYKLEQFPFVCRMCLKPETKKGMIPLSQKDPVFDGSIQDFITAITFEVAEPNCVLLPRAVCQQCLELLKFFAKFRLKMLNMHHFMNSLIELKNSNSSPMINLFETKRDQLTILFKDLDLCTKKDVTIKELLDEFPNYHIAKLAVDDKITLQHGPIKDPTKNVQLLEECTADELAEMIFRSVRSESEKLDEENPTPTEKALEKYRKEEPLKCQKCKYSTHFPANFRNHQAVHLKKEEKTYECVHSGCTEVFNDSRSRSKHYRSVHKTHVCDVCGVRFAHANRLTVHKERHLNLLSYCCTYCDHRCNTKSDLTTHINVKHNAAYFFACVICGVRFKRKSAMKDHMNGHNDERKYKCNQCDKSFHKLSALRRHKKMVHENFRRSCEHCQQTFFQSEMLRDHIEYVHGIQVRFICDICLHVFYDQDSLNTHKLRHANPKELECGVCLDVFTSSDLMKEHLCITYRDDYICCGKNFWYHLSYNKHMLVEHGVRTNVRVKPDPNHLFGYIRSTRTKKPIRNCPKCSAIFTTIYQKREHLKVCDGPLPTNKKRKKTKPTAETNASSSIAIVQQ
ncbi:zinc finger protein 99-like [Wyeomyia smithii]|uniref:zinc finger protein 99-like n=1 Tax=Wyeomyia smithii TaxID=174621 RepID=UPI002467D5A6|nr:zinc finger protein 99-like [Wyeomyia smithii]